MASTDPQRFLATLQQLAQTLQDLPTTSAPQLSHYRELPPDLAECYELLKQGATLVSAEATKYTLLGKVDAAAQAKFSEQLAQGCRVVTTAALAVCNEGCASSTKRHVRQAARSIIHAVLNLVECFRDASSRDPAQLTGIIWEACNVILERKLPKGNRTAIRRDLLTFKVEVQDTIAEFEAVTYEPDVMSGCLGILKCSRGAINCSLDVMEKLGEVPSMENLERIARVLELVRPVGMGVTDFGSTLYDPLELEEVVPALEEQHGAVKECLEYLASLELDLELVTKVRHALTLRYEQTLDAITEFRKSNE